MLTDRQIVTKNSECISTLMPYFRQQVGQWYEKMIAMGVTPYIYFGFRSSDEQQRIYDSGVRPCALPGQSLHNWGAAIDWVPVKRMETAKGVFYEADWDNERAYEIGVQAGKELGLVPPTGRDGRILETGHLQDARFSGWQDAKRAYEQSLWPTA